MTIEQLSQLSQDVERLRAERDALLEHGFPLPDPDAVPKLRLKAGKYERIESPQRDNKWTLGKRHISVPARRNFARALELKQKLRNTERAAELWRELLAKENTLKMLKSMQSAVMAFA